jgi:hypothetical protein
MIIAKPVRDKEFWILQQDDRKVGNVEAINGGYVVMLNDTVQQYKTMQMVQQRTDIQFEPMTPRPPKSKTAHDVHGYPTAGRVHNAIWDVQKKLPLFTKTAKSKSWFAAGWYRVLKGRAWRVVQDPKLITLQRYKYYGPYMTETEAQ